MALFSKEPGPASQPPVRRDTPAPAGGTTVIGADVSIEGTLSGSEAVIAEGTIKGNVNLTNDLRIGTKGRVAATVHARSIVIEGKVEGDVSADDRVELVAGSSVQGNIKAPKIVVAEGARFRGNVDMGGSPPPREGAEQKTK